MNKTEPSKEVIQLSALITPLLAGKRLDQALALLFPEYSRSRLKEWVENHQVLVNSTWKRPKDKVFEGDQIEIEANLTPNYDWLGEDLSSSQSDPLNIVFEDEHILVINKPNNLVVHPGAGNRTGTLVNALLHRIPDLNQLPRAGIVHRLDKDTTGLMVVAKTLTAQLSLVKQLQGRTVKRIYEAVVWGVPTGGGAVNAPLGRHPRERTRMSVQESGKPAITHYRIVEKFKHHTHLRLQLETGRTHQIRVHMAYINHPLVGDRLYGGRLRQPPGATAEFQAYLKAYPRQALHATTLGLIHPITKTEMEWTTELPEDMQQLLLTLRKNSV